MQLTIKGEIKGLQDSGTKFDQLLQGFYIRNTIGLTNSKPHWTHESNGLSIWFDDAREFWLVGVNQNSQESGLFLASSTSPDFESQEAQNWAYFDFSDQWINSSDISIKRGM